MAITRSLINRFPKITTQVAVILSDHIWLIKRSDYGFWTLPGGKPKPNESLAEAAIRETLEETGLSIELTRLVGIYYLPEWSEWGHEILFAAKGLNMDVEPFSDELLEVKLFELNNLPRSLPWWHKSRIDDLMSGVSSEIVHKQKVPRRKPFKNASDLDAIFTFFKESRLSEEDFMAKFFPNRSCHI